MERIIKKCIRLKKSINDKIDIIGTEINQPYSYKTLEYLLELGILKYEELKFKAYKEDEILSLLEEIKSIIEKVTNNE